MWQLELRNAGKSSFYLWLRGTMEECLSEMLSIREGGRIDVDALRLTWSSDELEPEPELCRDPSCEVVMDGDHRHPDVLNLGPRRAVGYHMSVHPDGRVVHHTPMSCAFHSNCATGELAPGVVQHQHVWHEDRGMMVWKCVYEEGCPARLTWEELHRAGVAATADTLNTMWDVKLAAHPELAQ